MMRYLFAIISICAILFIGTSIFYNVNPQMKYKVGDCLVIEGDDSIFKVLEIGKYGIKTIRPRYNGFEEVYQHPENVMKAMKMDCFDLFNKEN
jgi:hypothetical protein